MAIMKGPADGGQGGKRGHSNMDHWVFTEEIKAASRKVRRLLAHQEIAEELRLWEDEQTTQMMPTVPRESGVEAAGEERF